MKIKAKLIDVSYAQGVIDWQTVKPHIDGAILRCGYGMDLEKQDDAYFKRNADACTRLGIPFGVYLYSYADSVDRAKSEAAHVLRLIKGYKLSYPVYLDLEESNTRQGAVERAKAFGDIIEKAGYCCGIYANLNWWTHYLTGLDGFTKWVAQYYTKCQYQGSGLDMWQYSSKGRIPGISGNVDMNYCYRDFPAELGQETKKDKPDRAASFTNGICGVYEVTAKSGLHLRSGASVSKKILELMPRGTKVRCYGFHTGSWFYVVSSAGNEGFCHKWWLRKR